MLTLFIVLLIVRATRPSPLLLIVYITQVWLWQQHQFNGIFVDAAAAGSLQGTRGRGETLLFLQGNRPHPPPHGRPPRGTIRVCVCWGGAKGPFLGGREKNVFFLFSMYNHILPDLDISLFYFVDYYLFYIKNGQNRRFNLWNESVQSVGVWKSPGWILSDFKQFDEGLDDVLTVFGPFWVLFNPFLRYF